MSLALAHQQLGWPDQKQVLAPHGAGPKVMAQLAEAKIGQSLRRLPGGKNVKVGVLTGNAEADATESPIAVVCDFPAAVSPQVLREAHRLAWNFCRSPLLITLEGPLVKAWTCCEPPAEPQSPELLRAEVDRYDLGQASASSLSQQVASSLHWVQLASGKFFQRYADRFKREKRADETLLANLAFVREQLKGHKLGSDVAHDLLARVIFIQFLFQRRDSSGQPALNESMLHRLWQDEHVFSKQYSSLSEILGNYDDAYRLFRWLNVRFNGDLFPGKGATKKEREAEWQAEMREVKPDHLRLLAQFVSGEIQMKGGQKSFWPYYSFDAIPLEFISSIYEMFVDADARTKGVHYTPGYLVDGVLDGILPWNSRQWNMRILDPACGSGIFLVKAFQRLIYRWRLANPGKEPNSSLLKRILEKNLFGVDIDRHAVRVASFSLYLAMCDEIDPRHYWTQVKFPRLRDSRLVNADFFDENVAGIRTASDAASYDLVIGNAPWGKNTATDPARKWSSENGWGISNEGIGTLFLPKAASLAKRNGRVRMIQPASSLLFNRIPTAVRFRKKLFETYKIDEIINLSALRFVLFSKAISPACIVTLSPSRPDGAPIQYISPKTQCTTEDSYRIMVEPHDVHAVALAEAVDDATVWTTLMWGGRRDYALIQRLATFGNLEQLRGSKKASIRRGVSRGDRALVQRTIKGMRMLESEELLPPGVLRLNAATLPANDDPRTHSRDSTDMSAFQLPQMLLKQSWSQSTGRFRAVIVRSSAQIGPVFCSRSFTSVHVPDGQEAVLESACLTYNSRLPVYYLLLTSGRFATYRPEPNEEELLRVPIPAVRKDILVGAKTPDDWDVRVEDAFGLKDAERVLIDDLFRITLPDFKGGADSPGRVSTRSQRSRQRQQQREPVLSLYCNYFLRVLTSLGLDGVSPHATVFQESDDPLPVRLVAVHFGGPHEEQVLFEQIDSGALITRLREINESLLKTCKEGGGIFYQRIVRHYMSVRLSGSAIPTVFLVKPDQVRYWTPSAAIRDADEVFSDMWAWKPNGRKNR